MEIIKNNKKTLISSNNRTFMIYINKYDERKKTVVFMPILGYVK